MQDQASKISGRKFGEIKEAFRIAFSKLGIMRTHVPGIPVLAHTATADKQTEKHIIKSLCMKKCLVLRVSPNRLNVALYVFKKKKLLTSDLKWIVDGLRTDRGNFPKTIVYCQIIESVTKVFT